MGIREDMPLLAAHEGVWDGVYRYYDAGGRMVDEHRSRIFCRFPDGGEFPYHQTNYYAWGDGRTEMRDFPATYRDGRVWWDNALIKGWAAPVTLDEHNRTMMLYWQRTGDPDLYLYEMINAADDGETRCRTWHWIRKGRLETRTGIEERRVSRDWRAMEGQITPS